MWHRWDWVSDGSEKGGCDCRGKGCLCGQLASEGLRVPSVRTPPSLNTSPYFTHIHLLMLHPPPTPSLPSLPNEPPDSVSKTDQICFDWVRFPKLFKAVSHFNDIIKGPRQEDESFFFVFRS